MSKQKKGNETFNLFDVPDENQNANHTLDVFFDEVPSSAHESSSEDNSLVTISRFDDVDDNEPTLINKKPTQKFIPKKVLGEGGMGKVYSAEEPLLHRDVAIKKMLKKTNANSAYWKRFMREAQITAQLSHPAIVPIYGLEFDEFQQPFLVMKKIDGKTLTDYIELCSEHENDEKYSIKTRVEKMIHVCSAMSYAHSHGVIHRDLKPDNIMMGSFDEMIVMDWGTARLLSENVDSELLLESDVSVKTMYGALIGTPIYMAPEQAQGKNELIGTSCDLFALGVILYELIELRPPRRGKGLTEILQQAIAANPLVFSEKTPAPLQSIIHKATAKNIENRYASVAELGQDLRLYIRGEPISIHPESAIRKIWRKLSKHPVLAISTLFISLLFTMLLVIYSLNRNLSHQKEIQFQQERTAYLIDTVSTEARLIDNMLSNIQIQLNGLTRAASLKYRQKTTEKCIRSQDLAKHKSAILIPEITNHPISTKHTTCFLAPTNLTTETPLGEDLGVLLLPDILSIGYTTKESDDQRNIDSKIQWIYVGTESGVIINYPGLSFFPESYDPRKRPWYDEGKKNTLPQCGNPYPDASGSGYLLPCTQRIDSPQGEFIGITGVDLELDEVIEIIQEYEGFILNENQEIMLQSSDKGFEVSSEEAIRNNKEKEREALKNELLVEELNQSHLNGVVFDTNNNKTYAYARLQFAPWTLVLEFTKERQDKATAARKK